MTKLWDKGIELNHLILNYTSAEDSQLDKRLIPYDLKGSDAHAKMLHSQGYLKDDELDQIVKALNELAISFEEGRWNISANEEDCHSAIENALTRKLDQLGGKIHLGRSRNDQLLCALRLYLLDVCNQISQAIDDLIKSLDQINSNFGQIAIPGYTHLQQAMPSSVQLWAQGFISELDQNKHRVAQLRENCSLNPLGSAAGYGTPGLNIDRELTTQLLQFNKTQDPVTSVQISRGKLEASMAFECSLILCDLSKLCSDIILFNTQEFDFVKLKDEITTGSSIMPQKKNPDIFELARSASSVPIATIQEIFLITSKLTSGYHRDLQRIKAPLFRCIDITIETIQAVAFSLENLLFIPENISLDDRLHATEKAYRMVQDQGISFREAYQEIAKLYK